MKNKVKIDVGLIWGKALNIWSQVGILSGAMSTMMMIGVFYTTTVYPNIKIPLWSYLLSIFIIGLIVLIFILRWGIKGYFKFFSNQSALTAVNDKIDEQDRKIELIMKHFNIEDKDGFKR